MERVNAEPRDGLQRPCAWPDCRSSYPVTTGPASDGWKRGLGLFVAVCPLHADLGHLPDVETVPQVPPFRAHGHVLVCQCGTRGPRPRLSLGPVVQDWRDHLATLPEPDRLLS